MRIARLVVVIAGAALCAGGAAAQEQVETTKAKASMEPSFTSVTDQMLLDARKNESNWVTYGRDYWNQRWSPLNQINTSNVGSLHMAWMYQTGISRLGSFETSPIVIDGVMYLTTPYNTAMAVNARTGKEIWRYEHKQSIASPIFCCGPNNRGVAISEGTVFMATLDAHLVALDAKTGAVQWDVQVEDPEAGYSETMAPLIVGDKVIVGISGGEYGIRGFIRAYNKSNGQPLWTAYTIFDKGWEGKFATTTNEGDDLHRNVAAEKTAMAQYGDAWQRGGGGVWMTPSYDPTKQLFLFALGKT